MKYEELKNFIVYKMKPAKSSGEEKNYQPVMIRTLNQNHGEATREKIIKELHKYNPKYPINHFSDCTVFDVLQKHNVVKFNPSKNMYELPDYDEIDTSFGRKAEITKLCDRKIERPISIALEKDTINEVIEEFLEWLEEEEAQNHLQLIEKEKKEVKEIMNKLEKLDKSSEEFTNHVLYGLLPHYDNTYAIRVSTFPVFRNIRKFLKSYNYTENDWNKIANIVFELARKFQNDPDNLEKWIQEFKSNGDYTRMLQTGALSPILFAINDSFPVINNRIKRTYKDFSRVFGWDDRITRHIESYPESIKKCKRLIETLQVKELENLAVFDLFCYWYDYIRRTEQISDFDEEETDTVKSKVEKIDLNQFIQTVQLKDKKKFEPHFLPNPERIRINEIIKNVEKGKWKLPYFQRYFDWKQKDIEDLLESIFRDYYVGSFLLWEPDKPPIKTDEILGSNLPTDTKPESIILDGQQRITSLFYAIKCPEIETEKIKKPVYFYVNFKTFFLEDGSDKNFIITLNHKLSDEECFQSLMFPFYELENYEEWIYRFEDFIETLSIDDKKKLKEIQRKMQKKLSHLFNGFEIPYITLPETFGMPEITDIFEQINTKGKTLNVFDLLNAKLSVNEIELKTLWNESKNNFEKLKEYKRIDKLPIYILQAISLFHHRVNSCKKEDLLNIFENIFKSSDLNFEEEWDTMSEYMNEAIKKLENKRDGYGIHNRKHLPYAPTIPILASLLRLIDERSNKAECNNRLDMWYWSSLFVESYSGAVDSQLTADFREMNKWFDDPNKIPKSVEKIRREYRTTINLREIQSTSNVRFRAVLSLIALKGGIDFDTNRTLENSPNNEKHHIFPKATFSLPSISSILNYTWLSNNTNGKIVRDKKPSIYIPEFIKEKYNNNKKQFLDVLDTHFINDTSFDYLVNDDFENFILERNKILINEIGKRIGATPETELSSMLHPEREFDNEMLIEDKIKKCDEYIQWVDNYFRPKGLKWISRYLPKEKVKNIKILTSKDTATEDLRDLFKKLKNQLSHDGITCEMRVIVDNKLKGQIHGRWLITKDNCFIFQSVDTISRGAYDVINEGAEKPPFDEWWNNSLDIIDDWNKINDSK